MLMVNLPTHRGHGSIEIIYGCMFSGKSKTAYDRCLNRETFSDERWVGFKSPVDTRAGKDYPMHIKLHPPNDKGVLMFVPAVVINNMEDAFDYLSDNRRISFVWFDEGQFIGAREKRAHTSVMLTLKEHGYGVVGAYLDETFNGDDFPLSGDEHTSDVIAIADVPTHNHAICQHRIETGSMCRKPAIHSQRFNPDGSLAKPEDPILVVGEERHDENFVSFYEARCNEDWINPRSL
ncbi:MAG: hypothetical protein ABIH90_00030 [Candidatus Aenigmatarchaeota archaeon]